MEVMNTHKHTNTQTHTMSLVSIEYKRLKSEAALTYKTKWKSPQVCPRALKDSAGKPRVPETTICKVYSGCSRQSPPELTWTARKAESIGSFRQ